MTVRRTLVTSGRFQPATALVRALDAAGARVDVADSYALSPALHSHRAARTHHVAPAAREPLRFVDDVAAIVREREIDLIVPSFEEGFFLARYASALGAPLLAPAWETAVTLHDKARFVDLCARLGLPVPPTIVARDRDRLSEAVGRFEQFVARPAYSRGGMAYLTNHGPRAGESTIDDCAPTADNPWLVQPYLDGRDACSYSVAHEGRIVLHCVYEPTVAAEGGWSIQFQTIDDFGTLAWARRVAADLGYTGSLGFDYRRTPDGPVMIECNPRSSAGAFFVPSERLGSALLGASDALWTAPAGDRRQYDAYLLDPHIATGSPTQIVRDLLSTPDAFFDPGDVLPAFFFLLGRRHWHRVATREHVTVGEAFVADMSWNGEPMPDPPAGKA